MSPIARKLQKEVKSLSYEDLFEFSVWFCSYVDERSNQKHHDDGSGIPYKEVLTAFKQATLMRGGKLVVRKPSDYALDLAGFYKETRVKECRLEDGADMLAVFWGAVSPKQFRLAYMRQLHPPPTPKGDDLVMALTIELLFPMSDKLRRLDSGHRWFRSLRHLQAFSKFVLKSRVATAVSGLAPSKALLTYKNVE